MKVWKYGDDINTDMLFPGKYTYTCSTPEEIKPHLLEDLDPTFADGVTEGDFLFAGKNFGCGSSREQPAGIRAISRSSWFLTYPLRPSCPVPYKKVQSSCVRNDRKTSSEAKPFQISSPFHASSHIFLL